MCAHVLCTSTHNIAAYCERAPRAVWRARLWISVGMGDRCAIICIGDMGDKKSTEEITAKGKLKRYLDLSELFSSNVGVKVVQSNNNIPMENDRR